MAGSFVVRVSGSPTRAAPTRPQRKHLAVVLDLSASMYTFNRVDERLDRQLASVVLLLEAFNAVPARGAPLTFELSGHSGDEAFIDLNRARVGGGVCVRAARWRALTSVASQTVNQTRAQAFRLLKAAALHPQFCASGDHTLEAADAAVERTARLLGSAEAGGDDGGAGFVVVISDAHLRRYGIGANDIRQRVESAAQRNVTLRFVFICDSWEARQLAHSLGAGVAVVCDDPATLPDALRVVLLKKLR